MSLGGNSRFRKIIRHFSSVVTYFYLDTPSYAWYLGETAEAKGIDPAKDLAIQTIIVAGEPGGSIPATREAIEELWDADLYDF